MFRDYPQFPTFLHTLLFRFLALSLQSRASELQLEYHKLKCAGNFETTKVMK